MPVFMSKYMADHTYFSPKQMKSLFMSLGYLQVKYNKINNQGQYGSVYLPVPKQINFSTIKMP